MIGKERTKTMYKYKNKIYKLDKYNNWYLAEVINTASEMTEEDYNSFEYSNLKLKYYSKYTPEVARKKATKEYLELKGERK
jgi:hypothetical protein